MIYKVDYLDIMIQYSCNLSCSGCITMTDYRRSGYVDIKQGKEWLEVWSKKINPTVVCLFGGEPLMNPDLKQWIILVRKFWPDSTIKLITNGLLLDKFDFLSTLVQNQPSELQISLHFRNSIHRKNILNKAINEFKKIDTVFKPNLKNLKPQEQIVFQNKNFKLIIAEFGDFVKPYRGYGKNMLPWNSNNIEKSHSLCGSPRNPILYKNRLYKCGPIGNLRDTLEFHNLENKNEWQKYLEYQGYGIDDDISELIDNFGKPEWICSMCCSSNNSYIDHYQPGSVKFKNETKEC